MESCGMSTIKYILFVFNVIFAISGIGIIAAGALVLTDVGEFSHFLEGKILALPSLLIFVGAIVLFVAFLGCYGAIKENYGLLMAYAVALAVIFVLEFGVGITTALYKSDFTMALKGTMKDSMTNWTTADQLGWKGLQTELKCCGVEGYKDWNEPGNSEFSTNGLLPNSCCDELVNDETCRSDQARLHKIGCYKALEGKVHQAASLLIGVGIGIAFIEIAGIVLACCLATSIRREGGET